MEIENQVEAAPKLTSLEKNGLFYVPTLFIQMCGMWPLNTFENKTLKTWYTIYKFFLFGYYVAFFVLLFIELIRLIIDNKGYERISQSAGLVFIILVLICKAIIYQKNEIPKMCLSAMKAEKDICRSNDKDVQDSYRKILHYNKNLNICLLSSSICTVVIFALISFLELFSVGVSQWNFGEKSFMYEVYFPFNKTNHFTVIVIFNIYAGFLGIILNIACQSTFYSLTIFAVSRLIILQIRIRKFDTLSRDLNMDIVLNIKGLIREHQNTIRFVEQLNESTKYMILLEFILNSINVAALSFQIIAIKSTVKLLYPVCHLSLMILHVFVLGWAANEVNIQSLALADAIYESPWYKQNKSAKQMLFIMLMRAQKALSLSIGPFNPMTIETSIGTLKAAYSYVTLMTNRYTE